MSDQAKFVDLCLAEKAALDEIDDFVDRWHAAPQGQELHDYLGMSEEEYSLWLRVPDALAYILEARRDQRPLKEIVLRVCKLQTSPTADRLSGWLRERPVE